MERVPIAKCSCGGEIHLRRIRGRHWSWSGMESGQYQELACVSCGHTPSVWERIAWWYREVFRSQEPSRPLDDL